MYSIVYVPIWFYRGSSIGDLGDLTPCNASPNLNALMSFQRDDTEECWRTNMRSLLDQTPDNTLHMFHILHRVVKVPDIVTNKNNCYILLSIN